MSFRDIVLDLCPGSDSRRDLELAGEIAAAFGARLLVVAYAWPVMTVADSLPGSSLSAPRKTQEMQDAIESAQAAFEQVFSATSLDAEYCGGVGDPAVALPDRLWAADLLIAGASRSGGFVRAEPARLALRSGIPVLRLGQTVAASRFANVAVAWKNSPPAHRALHDALPILKRADKVTVIGVGDEIEAARLEAIAGHLRRHDVAASHLHLPHSEQDVGADLIAHARRENADLIVAGAYGRGPLAERLFGGVTRELLGQADLSWFMAH